MGRFLAQFRIRTILRTVDGLAQLAKEMSDREIVISNSSANDPEETLLDLNIIFESDDIESAESLAEEYAEDFSYSLAFVTSAAVRVERPVFLIDWQSGLSERDIFVYGVAPFDDPADAIDIEMLSSVAQAAELDLSPETRAAIRWFGRGLRAKVLEDQFQYFWFAIEILATAKKISSKVRDKCQRCGSELECPNPECGHPEHRPFEGQKIGMFLESLGLSAELAGGIVELRNQLMHGEDRKGIMDHMTAKWPDFALDKAVKITERRAWQAIASSVGDAAQGIRFYEVQAASNMIMTFKNHMRIGLKGDPNDPKIEDVWLPTIEMVVTDPKTGKERVVTA